jgi:hypothetical protein
MSFMPLAPEAIPVVQDCQLKPKPNGRITTLEARVDKLEKLCAELVKELATQTVAKTIIEVIAKARQQSGPPPE